MFVWKATDKIGLFVQMRNALFMPLDCSCWKASTTDSSSGPTLTLTQGHSACQIRGRVGGKQGGINSDMENIDSFLSYRLVTCVCLLVLFHPLWSFYY